MKNIISVLLLILVSSFVFAGPAKGVLESKASTLPPEEQTRILQMMLNNGELRLRANYTVTTCKADGAACSNSNQCCSVCENRRCGTSPGGPREDGEPCSDSSQCRTVCQGGQCGVDHGGPRNSGAPCTDSSQCRFVCSDGACT